MCSSFSLMTSIVWASYCSSTFIAFITPERARRAMVVMASPAPESAMAGEVKNFSSSSESSWSTFSPRRTSSLTSLRESFSNWPHTGSSTMAETRRNTVCTFAMPPEESASSHRALSTPNECSSISPTITRIEPAMLKRIWITPVRLASAFEPMEQTMAVVTQSPMLTPMMMA